MSIETKILDELLKNCPNQDKLYFDCEEVDGYPKTKTIKYYYEDYIYNLYVDKMYFLHRISFENASTKKLEVNRFGLKNLSYIASSSALLFNTLGNDYVATILDNDKLPKGRYKVKYEEPYPLLNNEIYSSATLKSNDGTVIMIDCKFLENLEPIKDISEDYLNPKKYAIYSVDPKIAESFAELYRINLKPNSMYESKRKKYYKPLYNTYDLFRVFNYAFGFLTDYIINKKRAKYKDVNKVILTDVLWHTEKLQPDFLSKDEASFKDKFLIEEYGYIEVKKYFVDMINSIYSAARTHGVNITFDFEYIPWREFVDCIKNDDRKAYLKRYDI